MAKISVVGSGKNFHDQEMTRTCLFSSLISSSTEISDWSYVDKLCLAPMVRVGTLPLRVLSKHYGADIVYTDEIIDRKIVNTTRTINPDSGVIEYKLPEPAVKSGCPAIQPVFATYPGEPVVFQIGTSDPVRALTAANHVAQDVQAIDINMGCPRPFSLSGGMGSALLTQPELVHDIVCTLTRNLNLPITCKIRVLECPKTTLELCRRIEACGASAVGVHARYVTDRDRFRCMPEQLPPIVSALSIPVIFNGDIFQHEDIEHAKTATTASSIMIARGAQWNPSIFQSSGSVCVWDVMSQYLSVAKAVGNSIANTKYVIMKMKSTHCRNKSNMSFCKAKTHKELEADLQLLSTDPGLTGSYKPPCVLLDRPETVCDRVSGVVRGSENDHDLERLNKKINTGISG